MSRNSTVDKWGAQKSQPDGSLVGTDTPMPLAYGMMLVAGSLVGFGALVSLSPPHGRLPVSEVAPMVHESHAAAEAPASPSHAEPSHHETAEHHPAAEHHQVAEHHQTAEHHEPDPAEQARIQARETFTDKFMSRFLSTNCDKNRNSETGVQFGVNSYSEFTRSKRTRYVEGEYRFGTGGFKLIADEDSQLEFKMNGDTLAMAGVMIDGVTVAAQATAKWKACRSDPHETPLEAPTVVRYDPSDGLRLALAANDLEAASHYLALGGYIPATEFTSVVKAANLEGPISTPIRETSRLNEDNALKRKAVADALEAKHKADEARHKAELAKQAKAQPKPGAKDAKDKEKDKDKEKPKEGGHH